MSYGIIILIVFSLSTYYQAETDDDLQTGQVLTFFGNSASFKCLLVPSTTSVVVIWRKENDYLIRHDSDVYEEVKGKYISKMNGTSSFTSLEILNVTYEDSGNYSCLAYQSYKGIPPANSWTLSVQGPLTVSLDGLISHEHDVVTASCCFNFSRPSLETDFIWMLDNNATFNNFEEHEIYVSENMVTVCSMLQFTSLRSYNKKQLICMLNNSLSAKSGVILDVLYLPLLHLHIPYSSSNQEKTLYVNVNSKFNLSCTSEANPKREVILQKLENRRWIAINDRSITRIEDNIVISEFLIDGTTENTQFRCLSFTGEEDYVTSNEIEVVILNPSVKMLTNTPQRISKSQPFTISCRTLDISSPTTSLQKLLAVNYWATLSLKPILDGVEGMNFTWHFVFTDVTNNIQGTYRCISVSESSSTFASGNVGVEIISSEDRRRNVYVDIIVIVTCVAGVITVTSAAVALKARCSASAPEVDNSLETFTCEATCQGSRTTELFKKFHHVNNQVEIDPSKLLFTKTIVAEKVVRRWIGLLRDDHIPEIGVQISGAAEYHQESSQEWTKHLSGLLHLGKHQNVVSTMGYCLISNATFCVQKYPQNGTVRSYIEVRYNNKYQYRNTTGQMPQLFVSFAMDIVRGIRFLNANGFLHPGLSIDKLLLSDDATCCLLHDFYHESLTGMKVITLKTNKKNLLFLAPEVILKNDYTFKSELWAIAITFWEIFSYGANIPVNVDKTEHMRIHEKLTRPFCCPHGIYDIMKPCWSLDPRSRPTLDDLETSLEDAKDEYWSIDDESYDETYHYSAPSVDPDSPTSKCPFYDPVL